MELCFICNGLIHPGAPRRPVHRETEDGPLRVGSLHPAEMNCQPPAPREATIDLGEIAFGAHTGAEEHWNDLSEGAREGWRDVACAVLRAASASEPCSNCARRPCVCEGEP